jgi:hypothetical protein
VSRAHRPNAAKYHDPSPKKLRTLLITISLPLDEVCARAGIGRRTLERYLAGKKIATYPVQYVLEQMAYAKLHDADIARTRKPRSRRTPVEPSVTEDGVPRESPPGDASLTPS